MIRRPDQKHVQWTGISFCETPVWPKAWRQFASAFLGKETAPDLTAPFKMLPENGCVMFAAAKVRCASWQAWLSTGAPAMTEDEAADEQTFQELVDATNNGERMLAANIGLKRVTAGTAGCGRITIGQLLELPFGVNLPEVPQPQDRPLANTAARFRLKKGGSVKRVCVHTGAQMEGEWDSAGDYIAYREPAGFSDVHGIPVPPITRVA